MFVQLAFNSRYDQTPTNQSQFVIPTPTLTTVKHKRVISIISWHPFLSLINLRQLSSHKFPSDMVSLAWLASMSNPEILLEVILQFFHVASVASKKRHFQSRPRVQHSLNPVQKQQSPALSVEKVSRSPSLLSCQGGDVSLQCFVHNVRGRKCLDHFTEALWVV